MEEEYHAYTTSVWQILLVSWMIQWTMMTVMLYFITCFISFFVNEPMFVMTKVNNGHDDLPSEDTKQLKSGQ